MTDSSVACQVQRSNLFRIDGSAPLSDPNLLTQNSPESVSESIADLGLLQSDLSSKVGDGKVLLESLLTSKTPFTTKSVNRSQSEEFEKFESKTVVGPWRYRIHRAMRLAKVIPQERAYLCLNGGISADKVKLIKDQKNKFY